MSLTPEEQAKAATRIGELEQQIAQKHADIAKLNEQISFAARQRLPGLQAQLDEQQQARTRLREEANTLRAQIGLPLVVPEALPVRPSPEPPAPPAPTAVRNGFFALLGTVIVVIFVLSRLNSSPAPKTDPLPTRRPVVVPAAPAPKTSSTVRYNIHGTAKSVSVTYQNGSGDTEQISEVRVPWDKSVTMERGAFVYIAAQNQGDSGTVTCTIYVDSLPVKTSTSNGAYTIATCSGRLP
jgi:TolA-binding protein